MKNKTLAIFGIATYLLSVLSSVTNEQGESTMPPSFLLISGILSLVFIIIAVIRLWKYARGSAVLLISSSVLYFGAVLLDVIYSPLYGSPLILLSNIAKVINVLVFIWIVSFLWKMEKYKDQIQNLPLTETTAKSTLNKIKYESDLARYLLGLFKAATIIFIAGKIIGYFDFLSWWWIIAPFIISLIGSLINYLDWVPKNRFLFYSIYLLYATLRYAILRIILWMPILLALTNCFYIIKKYGQTFGSISIAIVATIATYLLTIKLSGRSPGMPD